MTVTLSQTSATYDGTDLKPTVTVKLGDKVIGKDEYMVKYMVDGEEVLECIESGEYTVVVSDKEGGKYTLNETTLTFIVVRVKAEAELAYLETEFTNQVDKPFEAPELQNPNKLSPINYSSSDESVATVDTETGEVLTFSSISMIPFTTPGAILSLPCRRLSRPSTSSAGSPIRKSSMMPTGRLISNCGHVIPKEKSPATI